MMNYGKIVRLLFDQKVWHVSNIEKTRFRLINAYSEVCYPINITYGENDHEVYLHFTDINLFGANKLECLETIKMGSESIHLAAFVIDIFLDNLQPTDSLYVGLSSINVFGKIDEAFDGKMYFDENEHCINLSSVSTSGQIQLLSFYAGYIDENTNFVNINSINVSGQYCDVNGTPV